MGLAAVRARTGHLLVAVGLLAVLFVLIRVVLGGGELGHDEAAYAVKARAWVAGTPDTGWSLHRGVGQSILAAAVIAVTDSAVALRLAAVALSMGTVAAVWGLGRVTASSGVGILAAGVFAVAPSFLRRGAEFLTDVPSTGLLLVVTILLWRWAGSTAVRDWYLYGAVTVGVLAFYVRYQSLLSLALLAIATASVGWVRVRGAWPAVARAAGLGAVLLVPHLVHSVAATGTPWGIVAVTAEAGGRRYLGEGIVDYLRDFPDLLAGQLGAVAILAALGWFGWALTTGRNRRRALFLMIPAIGQVAVLGLISHGEPRFVFFPVALSAVAGATAVDEVRLRLSHRAYRVGVATVVLAMVASLGLHGERADRQAEARAVSVQALAEAAAVVRAQTAGPCGIVTGSQPQLTWLSRCLTAPFDLAGARILLEPSRDGFMVLSGRGPREPRGGLRDAYIALTEGDSVVIDSTGAWGRVEVWNLAD